MGWAFDEPALVIVAVSLAAAFLVAELALPTLGVAGTLAAACVAFALLGVREQGAEAWPLIFTVLAVVLWAVELASRRRWPSVDAAAVVLHAAGSTIYGALSEDAVAVGVAAVATAALATGFPVLHRLAVGLLERPAKVGPEWLIDQEAVVDRWEADRGTIVVQGSRWNAEGDRPFAAGDRVTITAFRGMTAHVAVAGGRPPGGN